MENSVMKIVFIDAANRLVRIIDKNEVREYNWNDIDGIADEISSRDILYITSLEKKNGSDVVELISRNTGKKYKKAVKTGRKFIREVKAGRLIVKHQNEKEKPLIFDNPIDFKVYSDELTITYPNIDRYVEIGKLEIVDEGDIARIRKEYMKVSNAKSKKRLALENKNLDSILVSEPANKLSERIESEGYDAGDDDYEPLDITDEVMRGGTSRQDEDFFQTAKDAGINISDID